MNPGLIVLKNIFKTLNLIRCPESNMHSRNEFEKSYLPQKANFLIFYVSNINFKKPRIEEKYWIKFKKFFGILFLQKVIQVLKFFLKILWSCWNEFWNERVSGWVKNWQQERKNFEKKFVWGFHQTFVHAM